MLLEEWRRAASCSRGSGSAPARPVEQARLTARLLRGLGHLHAHGVMHRDIKPSNLLLSSARDDALLLISDFGLCALHTAKHDDDGGEGGGDGEAAADGDGAAAADGVALAAAAAAERSARADEEDDVWDSGVDGARDCDVRERRRRRLLVPMRYLVGGLRRVRDRDRAAHGLPHYGSPARRGGHGGKKGGMAGLFECILAGSSLSTSSRTTSHAICSPTCSPSGPRIDTLPSTPSRTRG